MWCLIVSIPDLSPISYLQSTMSLASEKSIYNGVITQAPSFYWIFYTILAGNKYSYKISDEFGIRLYLDLEVPIGPAAPCWDLFRIIFLKLYSISLKM